MKYLDFPIPIENIATKKYVNGRLGEQVSVAIGIVNEHLDDNFKIIKEGINMLAEKIDRLEFKVDTQFEHIDRRFDMVEVRLYNLEN